MKMFPMAYRLPASLLVVFAFLTASTSRADKTLSLFDPARHMHVSEVRPGMRGYGLSVFSGTKIDRFDVEVISILKNFNPKSDVVLIKFGGANLEHNLAIAGMSGSPIYLYDDAGKARMIGAFAYGWSLQKDPIAGVQPIEYMLKLPESEGSPATQPGGADVSMRGLPLANPAPAEKVVHRAKWSLSDTILLPGMKNPPAGYPLAEFGKMTPNPRCFSAGGEDSRLQPMVTPLMVGGMSPRVLDEMGPLFRAYGFTPMQAGGAASGADAEDVRIEPGAVLGIPLVEGDVDMSAVGTCTEVIGNHVLAFGHPFNGEGRASLPIAGGSIQGIIANLSASFKIGALTRIRGTLKNDQTVGIAGELGTVPTSIPVDLHVKYADGSEDQTYHFLAAVHPKLTPMLLAAAMTSALTGSKELPENHTVDYDLMLEFANGKSIHVVNSGVNISAADLFFEVGTPLTAAADNPFLSVMVKKITGEMTVSNTVRDGQILYASFPRSKYRPGDKLTAYVTFRPFREDEKMMPVEMDLPRDLPDGVYTLSISDWQKYFADERSAEPFKFTAETVDQVFDVLQGAAAIRHDALYLRLVRQADGVAIGHTAMPKLPSSRRQILIGSGRSDTTGYVSSMVKVVQTDRVMTGSADFQISIDKNADESKSE